MISGAMRTTATDVLEAHCDMLPFALLVDKLCHRAALRLCTLPKSHPLAKHVRSAARCYVKQHKSPIHEIIDAYGLDPDAIETIHAVRFSPQWTPGAQISIAESKEKAREDDEKWVERTSIRVYSDGSDFEGGVGAAAVLVKDGQTKPKILRYYLGPSEEHTVYEAEIVGEILGTELLRREAKVSISSIAADNKASLQATKLRRPAASHYLMDELHARIEAAKRKHRRLDLTMRWVPGHMDIEGNELADKEAKKAAAGNSSDQARLPRTLRKGLPASKSALKRTFEAKLKVKALESWRASPRYAHMKAIDPTLPGTAFEKLVANVPRSSASLILQLRTGHAPLNYHLHRIGKAETPTCPECGAQRENVPHILFVCPAYHRFRTRLRYQIGRNSVSLRGLLGTSDNVKHTLEFIHKTGRMKAPFGTIQPAKK